jgi:hypothetical protein
VLIGLLAFSASAADVAKTYDGLATLKTGERKAVVSRYEGPLQTELWALHLSRFTSAHPELTDEQRSVVFEARGLLATGLLQSLRSPDPEVAEAARNALLYFEARASRSFTKELYAEAFVRLGPAIPRTPAEREAWMKVAPLSPDCYCNPNFDDCGGGECFTGGCRVMPDGCGTFQAWICTGFC